MSNSSTPHTPITPSFSLKKTLPLAVRLLLSVASVSMVTGITCSPVLAGGTGGDSDGGNGGAGGNGDASNAGGAPGGIGGNPSGGQSGGGPGEDGVSYGDTGLGSGGGGGGNAIFSPFNPGEGGTADSDDSGGDGGTIGMNGGDGKSDGAGGGGGGGDGQIPEDSTTIEDDVGGGKGGDGGPAGDGGGGGGGGSGIVLIAPNREINLDSTGSITGGTGGAGGPEAGGGGGGAGVAFSSDALNSSLVNHGTITGGNGGAGGEDDGNPGSGGSGVYIHANDATIVNAGTISGGWSGHEVTDPDREQANAITFAGNNNTLEIHENSEINGNIELESSVGTNTLRLGGDDGGSFDVEDVSVDGSNGGKTYRKFNTFEKSGASTWTLTDTTIESTPWTIKEGTLAISDAAALGNDSQALTFEEGTLKTTAEVNVARPVILSGPGAVDTDGNETTFSGIISGTGSLAKMGSGTLILTGQNTYDGETVIRDGVVSIAEAENLGTEELTLGDADENTSGTLRTTQDEVSPLALGQRIILEDPGGIIDVVTADAETTLSGIISGTGSLQKVGDGTLILAEENTYGGETLIYDGVVSIADEENLGAGDLTLGSVGTIGALRTTQDENTPLSLGQGITLGGLGGIIDVVTADAETTLSGVISGDGSLRKVGTGTLILAEENTYEGGTTLADGTLGLRHDDAMGTAALSVTGDATVQMVADNLGVDNDISITNTKTATLDTQNHTATLSGEISGDGSLRKIGTGTLILADENTYEGGTTLADGTLGLGHDNAMGTGDLDVTGDTTVQMVADNLEVDNDISIADTYTATLDTQNHTSTLSGVISGDGSLTKVSAGTLILAEENTYGGGTTLADGTLGLGHDNAMGTGDLDVTGDTTVQMVLDNLNISNAIEITNTKTATLDTQNHTATLSSIISGTGSLQKVGAGTLILAEENTYGGGTTLADGTLGLRHDDAMGTGDLDVTGDTTVQMVLDNLNISNAIEITNTRTATLDTQNHTATLSGEISGDGSLRKIGTGTLILAEENTYEGGTLIYDGVVSIADEENLGAGDLTLGSVGTIGALRTTQDENTPLSLGQGTTLGGLGGIIDVVIADAETTLSGVISGDGSLRKVGTGTLILADENTYGGETLIRDGVVSIAEEENLGAGDLTLGSVGTTGTLRTTQDEDSPLSLDQAINLEELGGIVDVQQANAETTLAGIISGDGSLQKMGDGTLILAEENTYDGETVIRDGVVSIAQEENLGAGDLTLGSVGTIGALRTTQDENTSLSLGQGITLGGLGGIIDVVMADAETTLSGEISGNGSLTKAGSGVLRLTEDNPYTGATTVTQGTLHLTGQIDGSSVTVEDTAFLTGTGSMGTLHVRDGGTVAPGNGNMIGTLNIEGDGLILEGTYRCKVESEGEVEYTPVDEKHDRIHAPASTDLDLSNGKLHIVPLGGYDDYATTTKYINILEADSIDQGFDDDNNVSFVPEQSAFFTYETEQDGNHINLIITKTGQNLVEAVEGKGNSGSAIEAFEVLPKIGSAEKFEEILMTAPDIETARRWLQQLDPAENGQMGSASMTVQLDQLLTVIGEGHRGVDYSGNTTLSPAFKALLAQHRIPTHAVVAQLFSQKSSVVPRAEAAFADGVKHTPLPQYARAVVGDASFWIQSSGRHSHLKDYKAPGTHVADMKSNTFRVQMGADYQCTPQLLLGLTTAYAQTHYKHGSGNGSGNVDSYQIGAYGAYYVTPQWYVDAVATVGYNRYAGERIVHIPAFHAIYKQNHHAYQYGGVVETGYDIAMGSGTVFTPFVNVGFAYLQESGYQEKGSDALSLTVKAKERRTFQTRTGGQLAKFLGGDRVQLYGFAKLAYTYRNTVGSSHKTTASFLNQSREFVVTAGRRPHHMLSAGIGSTMLFSNDVFLTVGYDGDFGQHQQIHQGYLKLGRKF